MQEVDATHRLPTQIHEVLCRKSMPRIDFLNKNIRFYARSRCVASTSCINEVFFEGVDARHRPLQKILGFMQEVDAWHRLPV